MLQGLLFCTTHSIMLTSFSWMESFLRSLQHNEKPVTLRQQPVGSEQCTPLTVHEYSE